MARAIKWVLATLCVVASASADDRGAFAGRSAAEPLTPIGFGDSAAGAGMGLLEPAAIAGPQAPRGGATECAPYSLYSQPPHVTSPFWARTSDAAAGYLTYDQFQASDPIHGIQFWGFDYLFVPPAGPWLECIEDPMTFEIKFYSDESGLPGLEVCSYTVEPARTPTGLLFNHGLVLLELNEYSAVLEPPCTIRRGWVSVQGVSVGTPTDCWFGWMSSPVGDGNSLQESDTTGIYIVGYDRAMCLHGPHGACCYAGHVCELDNDENCTSGGGVYQGDGTTCDPNPCLPLGDACHIALPIAGLPFTDARDTCTEYADDFDESCPDASPGSADVVYVYEPVDDICVTITLCDGQTDFDTKLYVYENTCPDTGNPYACNDDACTSAAGQDNVSRLCVSLAGGSAYYIVVDGHGGACGNYVLDIFEDTSPPTGTTGTIDSCYATAAAAEAAALAATTDLADDCTPADDLQIEVSTAGTCDATVTVSVTDGCGNTANFDYQTRIDGEPPVLTPAAIAGCYTTETAAQQAAIAATGAVDNCTAPESLVFEVATDYAGCSATITVTVTDECGHSDAAVYETSIDDQPPQIMDCPANIEVDAPLGECAATVTWTPPTAEDDCDLASFESTREPGSVFPQGTTTVTYTARDACDNETVCSFDITVHDVEDPVIDGCPDDITVDNDLGQCFAAVTWTAPVASDNCAIVSFDTSHEPGSAFPVGTTTVVYTAEDVEGNIATCGFDVTVNDTEAPVITACADPVTIYLDVGESAYVPDLTADVTASDNCDVDPTITQDPLAGTWIGFGPHSVQITVTDDEGLFDMCLTTVTVASAGPPRLVLEVEQSCFMPGEPVSVSVWMLGISETVVAGQFFIAHETAKLELLSVDAGDFPFVDEVYECSIVEGGTLAQCTPISGRIDYILGVEANGTGAAGDARMATLTFNALEPICDVSDLITWRSHDPPTRLSDGDGGPITPMLLSLDVTDASSPVVNDLEVIGAGVDESCLATVTFSATVSDDCCLDTDDVTVDVTLVGGTADLATPVVEKTLLPDGKTVVVSGSVEVSNVLACPATIQVAVVAQDCCGNVVIVPASATADVLDDTPPTISDFVVTGGAVDEGCSRLVVFSATVADNCCVLPDDVQVDVALIAGSAILGTPSVIKTPVGNTVQITGDVLVSALDVCPATVEVTVSASDCCGVGDSFAATADVTDATSPTVIACPEDILITTAPGQYTVVVTWDAPLAEDNCDAAPAITYDIDLGSDGAVDDTAATPSYTFPSGLHTVTARATDACGNVDDTCQFTVTVELDVSLLVDLEWRPVTPAVCPDHNIDIGLYAVSAGGVDDIAVAAIDVVLSWNPAHLELLGLTNNGPYGWLTSEFPDDSGADGLNDTWTDGDALYAAVAQAPDPALATPDGLLVTTMRFTAHAAGMLTQLVMLESAGSSSRTRVLSADVADLDITASIDTHDIYLISTGDLDCDGDVDFDDIDPFVAALGGQPAYEALYPDCHWYNADCNCDGSVDFGDIDPFVALLSGD